MLENDRSLANILTENRFNNANQCCYPAKYSYSVTISGTGAEMKNDATMLRHHLLAESIPKMIPDTTNTLKIVNSAYFLTRAQPFLMYLNIC